MCSQRSFFTRREDSLLPSLLGISLQRKACLVKEEVHDVNHVVHNQPDGHDQF